MLAHAQRFSPLVRQHHASFIRCSVPMASPRLFSGLSGVNDRALRPHSSPPPLSRSSPFLAVSQFSRACTPLPGAISMRLYGLKPSLLSPAISLQARSYSRRSGRNPWNFNGSSPRGDWLSTVKTGALLAVGAGAVVAAMSVGFGFIVFGAAGYGVYTLYQRFIAPYRSNSTYDSVQADIDRIFQRGPAARGRAAHKSPTGDRDLDSLVEGLPFVMRGVVKTLFSVVGGAMQSSMARAGELRRLTNEYMHANASIVSQLGSDVSISTPQSWMEYTMNGSGRVEAVFPVVGGGYVQAQVTAKATIGTNGELQLQELKYRNHRTGEVIDLLRNAPTSGPRKRVVEAEYVDLDDRK